MFAAIFYNIILIHKVLGQFPNATDDIDQINITTERGDEEGRFTTNKNIDYEDNFENDSKDNLPCRGKCNIFEKKFLFHKQSQ